MTTYNLYIFTTSDVPDVYINTIGYCIENYNINKVVLLSIVQDRGQRTGAEKRTLAIRDRIKHQLASLQNSKYLYRDQETRQWAEKEIPLEDYQRARYNRIADKAIDAQVIVYDSLGKEIDALLKDSDNLCIFDVSAILKGFLLDVYTIIRLKGVANIYVFELKLRERTYNESELIHNLHLDRGDYAFVNVAQSEFTKDVIFKSVEEEQKYKIQVEYSSQILELAAENFAGTILLIFSSIIVAPIVISVVLTLQEKWDDLEPWTFIIFGPLIVYLVQLLWQVFFRREFSLQPKIIYDWLYHYKINQITKELSNKLKVQS